MNKVKEMREGSPITRGGTCTGPDESESVIQGGKKGVRS